MAGFPLELPLSFQPNDKPESSNLLQALGCKSLIIPAMKGYDIARDTFLTIENGITFPVTIDGPAVHCNLLPAAGLAYRVGGFGGLVPVDASFTVLIKLNITAIGIRKIFFSDLGSGGSVDSLTIETTAASLWRVTWTTAGNTVVQTIGGTVTAGLHWLDFTLDTASTITIDGIQAAQTLTGVATRRVGTDLRLGRAGAFTTLGFDSDISFCGVFSPALPVSTRTQIITNPWSIFSQNHFIPTLVPTSGNIYTFAVSGGFALSGSSGLLRVRAQTVSGAVAFSGSNILQHVRSFIPAGSVVFSGTAPFSSSAVYTFTVSGGAVFSGSIVQNHIKILSSSGSIGCSGSVIQNHLKTFPVSGSVQFSGNASFYFVPAGGGGSQPPQRTLTGVGT